MSGQIARWEARFGKNPQAGGPRDILDHMRRELEQAADVPLHFIGKMSLAELHAAVRLPRWPKDGDLLFFCEPSTWGYDPLSAGHCRVIHVSTDQPVQELAAPTDLSAKARFARKGIAFRPEWTLPTSLDEDGLELSIATNDDYRDLFNEFTDLDDKDPVHRCGGHPVEIQGDMRLECQLVSHGLYCGDKSGWRDPRAAVLAAGAPDWSLLLQVDSDEDRLGWAWSDAGRIYFWARREDIAAARFEGAWSIVQSH